METRIQRALDGEIARSELTREEAQQVAEAEALFGQVVRAIRTEPLPDLSAGVLERLPREREVVRESPLDIIRGALAWFWRPHALTLRPATGFALAGLLAALLLVRDTPVPAEPQIFVQFRLDAPQAQQVSLAGDFTSWQPQHQLVRSETGTWTIVVALEPGVHDYAFIVDGERWVADPMAPTIDDGFGGLNSRLAVLAPDSREL